MNIKICCNEKSLIETEKIFTYSQDNSYQSFQATNTLDTPLYHRNHAYVLGLLVIFLLSLVLSIGFMVVST